MMHLLGGSWHRNGPTVVEYKKNMSIFNPRNTRGHRMSLGWLSTVIKHAIVFLFYPTIFVSLALLGYIMYKWALPLFVHHKFPKASDIYVSCNRRVDMPTLNADELKCHLQVNHVG